MLLCSLQQLNVSVAAMCDIDLTTRKLSTTIQSFSVAAVDFLFCPLCSETEKKTRTLVNIDCRLIVALSNDLRLQSVAADRLDVLLHSIWRRKAPHPAPCRAVRRNTAPCRRPWAASLVYRVAGERERSSSNLAAAQSSSSSRASPRHAHARHQLINGHTER